MKAIALAKLTEAYGVDAAKFEAKGTAREELWHRSIYSAPDSFLEQLMIPSSRPTLIIYERVSDDTKLEALAQRVRQVEKRTAKRKVWRLKNLDSRIDAIASHHSIAAAEVKRAKALVATLHNAVVEEGIDCLPDPQIDCDDGSIELVWFDKRHGRTLTFTVLPEGDEDGLLWMHLMERNEAKNRFDPAEEEIEAALAWIAGC